MPRSYIAVPAKGFQTILKIGLCTCEHAGKEKKQMRNAKKEPQSQNMNALFLSSAHHISIRRRFTLNLQAVLCSNTRDNRRGWCRKHRHPPMLRIKR